MSLRADELREHQRSLHIHKKKLSKIKSVISSHKDMTTDKNIAKRKQAQRQAARRAKDRKLYEENLRLVKRLDSISRRGTKAKKAKAQQSKLDKNAKKMDELRRIHAHGRNQARIREQQRIDRENLALAARLCGSKPVYNAKSWERDYAEKRRKGQATGAVKGKGRRSRRSSQEQQRLDGYLSEDGDDDDYEPLDPDKFEAQYADQNSHGNDMNQEPADKGSKEEQQVQQQGQPQGPTANDD
eukprot:TRINITY_DN70907_c0_g1_i1.p1 TRINITY_DN70907_c0_g1~~TRINITY_DN70907_c0_g1_i1.p1  ORF type:complete len:242 (-),score=99.63 TRINITY_DN70907_c0_g1_i1:51-776(-)